MTWPEKLFVGMTGVVGVLVVAVMAAHAVAGPFVAERMVKLMTPFLAVALCLALPAGVAMLRDWMNDETKGD